MSKRNQVGSLRLLRPGEGTTTIDIIKPTPTLIRGNAAVTFGINLGLAPVPDRRYVADVCFFTVDWPTVKVCFGQQKVAGEGLRSLLVIHMDREAAEQIVNGLESMRPDSLTVYAAKNKIVAKGLKVPSEEPDQTVA